MVRSQFSNAILSVFGLSDSTQLVSRTEYATTWSANVPTSQEYAVKVITLAGHELKYSLTVQILPPPAPTTTPAPTATRPLAVTPTQVPSVSSGDIPLLWRGDLRLSERPLSDLSPEAARFLETRDAAWGVAVIVPSQNTVYLANADQELEMASVVKVLIMLTVLDRAMQEHRYVAEDELELLWPMITESDNDSATYLWNQVGCGTGIKGYLARIGVSGITPYIGPYWGTSVASARAVSLVLARVAFSDLLDDSSRKLALELLLKVIPSQRWGICPQAGSQQNHKDIVGLKNGWYPEERGWRVNSAGFIVSSAGHQPAYTIAVMTNLQPNWPYGIDTIEGVSSRIHAMLHP
jgi:hypothetical protein